MSELFVCAELLRLGFAVFRAVSPACFCDLIAIKDGRHIEVEVRTGYRSPSSGKISFPSKPDEKNDVYAVYERNEARVYFFDHNKSPLDKI